LNHKRDRQESDGELNQLISFAVGDEEYGLDILRVKEVIRIREITRLPRAPSFVRGIINLRGDVIPIIDLRDRFGLEQQQYTVMTRVIVVDVDDRLVGMVVDAVSQVVRIQADQIDPPPPIVGGLSVEYIKGVGKLDERLVILLNIDRILTVDEKVELGRIVETMGKSAGSDGSSEMKSDSTADSGAKSPVDQGLVLSGERAGSAYSA
jgi:purine-binding chemotaxis protein CheW